MKKIHIFCFLFLDIGHIPIIRTAVVKEIYFAEIKLNKDKIKMNKLKDKTEKLLKRYPEYDVIYEGLSIIDIENKLKNKI